MIRCNLSILLAEQGIKITTVAKETGISRTTLTALASNRSSGIQLDTINTLCRYLKVGPERLIGFIPSEIKLVRILLDKEVPLIKLDNGAIQYQETIAFRTALNHNAPSIVCSAQVSVTAHLDSDTENGLDILTTQLDIAPAHNAENAAETEALQCILNTLPRAFLSDLEEDISYTHASISEPIRQLPTQFNNLKLKYSFDWSEALVLPYVDYRPLTPEEMRKLYPR